jgi:hypothetical protein
MHEKAEEHEQAKGLQLTVDGNWRHVSKIPFFALPDVVEMHPKGTLPITSRTPLSQRRPSTHHDPMNAEVLLKLAVTLNDHL